MSSSHYTYVLALAEREILRKLEELAGVETSVVSRQSGPAVLDADDLPVCDLPLDSLVADKIEDTRIWCSHVSHIIGHYLHPSLGRIFLEEANDRLRNCSTREFLATIHWLRRSALVYLADSRELPRRQMVTVMGARRALGAARESDGDVHESTAASEDVLEPFPASEVGDVDASVFIIHGHDHGGVNELVQLLPTRYQVRPVVMHSRMLPTLTLPEKFERCARACRIAIALLTPDDVGAKAGESAQGTRVRQNVLVELGWFWGRHGRHSLLLVARGGIDLPSDLAGVQPISYDTQVAEVVLALDAFMRYHNVRIRD